MLWAVVIPIAVPILFWGENPIGAFLFCYVGRYVTTLHGTWLVNSAAHMFGHRHYNATIPPAQLWSLSLVGCGEGAWPW